MGIQFLMVVSTDWGLPVFPFKMANLVKPRNYSAFIFLVFYKAPKQPCLVVYLPIKLECLYFYFCRKFLCTIGLHR